MANPNQNKINELNARIRGLKASMADMGYERKQVVRQEIKQIEEMLTGL